MSVQLMAARNHGSHAGRQGWCPGLQAGEAHMYASLVHRSPAQVLELPLWLTPIPPPFGS